MATTPLAYGPSPTRFPAQGLGPLHTTHVHPYSNISRHEEPFRIPPTLRRTYPNGGPFRNVFLLFTRVLWSSIILYHAVALRYKR